MTENEITLLHNELQRLESAANVLSEIMFICKSIGLRNAIAHEYMLEDLSGLYKDVFDCTPLLLDTVERVKKYCTRYSL